MNNKKSLFEIHIAVFLFGLAGLFGKWLALSPVIIVLGRVFFASVALVFILLILKQKIKINNFKHYILFFILGLVLSVHWISFFRSIQVSTVAVGLLSFSSFPIFTTFLEPLFFREKIVKINILYSFLCVTGIFLIVPRFDLESSVYQGVLWGLLSGLTFSVLTIINKKLTQQFSSYIIAFFEDFFAAVLLIPFFFILHPVLNVKSILLLCALGVFCTAGSHTLFIRGIRHIKAQTASIINTLEPVYGIIMAFLFLHEIPTIRTILGGTIILGSQISIILGFLKRGNENVIKV